jgi:hypothetical protein
MKSLLSLSIGLLFSGCFSDPQSARVDSLGRVVEATEESYAVIRKTPDAILDEMSSRYSGNDQEWTDAWNRENSTTHIDGQRTVLLLEIACYADVICHPIEYRLRVVTHAFVREHLDHPEVRNALIWIRSSYRSELPLDAPGDDAGDFKGILVESMKSRMKEYANELLRTPRETKLNCN